MDIELTQSEIDEVRKTLPLSDPLIEAIFSNTELRVRVVPDSINATESGQKKE